MRRINILPIILAVAVSFVIVIHYFNHIFSGRKVRKGTFYLAALGLFVLSSAQLISVSLKIRMATFNNVWVVGIACFLSLLYQGKFRLKLLYSILAVVFSVFAIIVVFYSVILLSGENMADFMATHQEWYLMIIVLFALVLFVLLSLTAKLLSNAQDLVPMRFIALLVAVPLIGVVGVIPLLQEVTRKMDSINRPTVLVGYIVLLCILFTNFVTFYLFDNAVKYMHKAADEQLLQKQIQLQNRFYKRLESSQTEIRKIRHDMKHRLEAVRIQLEEKNYAGAQADISSMLTNVETQRIVDSGNPLLDAILNLKLSEAQSAGIQVDAKVFVSSGLHLTFSDLCVLIGNAFDNAIEACQKIEHGREKRITLEMSSVNQALFFSIANSSADTSAEHLQSDKEDLKNHGFGLKSIRYIADQYNGSVTVRTDGQMFRLEVVLQNPN